MPAVPPRLQVRGILGDEPIEEAIRLSGMAVRRTLRAPDIFDDENISGCIGLDAFIAPSPHHTEEVFDDRGKVRHRLVNAAASSCLRGKQKAL